MNKKILHLTGICGSGKSTLLKMLEKYYQQNKINVIKTIDYEPTILDTMNQENRAFNRVLDELNNQNNSNNSTIHKKIVDHSIKLMEIWEQSKAEIILVDRWFESYDNLPISCRNEIEDELIKYNFDIQHVLLFVGDENQSDESNKKEISNRLLYTKEYRDESWWLDVKKPLEQWIEEEFTYQKEYQLFCQNSPFSSSILNTTNMDWTKLHKKLINIIEYEIKN